MKILKLIDDIAERRVKNLGAMIQRWPRRNPILSDIGDCDRAIEYGVANWEDREMFNHDVQARLEVGKEEEKRVVRELSTLGFEVILSQQPVEIKGKDGAVLATGRIDGAIRYDGEKFPIEIKSMHPSIFAQISSIEDFQKKPHLRKYVRQMQMYLYGNNCDTGLMLLTDCLGHWLLFPVYLSYEDCEWILKRLERIAANLKSKTLSDRIPYDSKICEKCPFISICLPDQRHEGMEILDNAEFEKKLERRETLQPLAKEFEQIDEEVKEQAKAVGKDIIAGEFNVFLKPGERTVYEIPDEIKLPFAVKKKQVTVKIVRNSKNEKA